jgi:adenosine deaminase
VIDDLHQHPLKRMLEAGLRATVNTDDPAYFGGYMNDNYIRTADAIGLTVEDVITLARNSFKGSFLPSSEIERHLADIDRIAAG